ncbi:MAG: hypothetical protein DI533_20525 [Cereibacter sphaeroides]|uniref:Uncharacterized protein n=1 Tax=Cereibacter sphaeroides TaxID=1063 RepID=A0A2W5RWL3_CERSP|nr:MAG: hypothetical protein DI533_20525 [Cereibacter sphaeroides]
MFKFCDGFDHYAAAGVTGPTLEPYLTAAGYTVRNALANTFAVVAGRRAGAYALQFNVARNSATNASLSWGFTFANNYACFGFAMNASGSRMRICRIENVIDVDWDTVTGKIKVGEQLGVNALILNAWYYFEIECDFTAKTVKIWANNELQLTVDISAVTVPTIATIAWGQVGTAPDAGVQLLDDFYVIDGSGTNNKTRLNPVEVTTRMPTADVGPKEWTVVVSPTGTPHYQIVSQLEPNKSGAPYLQSNTAGATDMFRSNTVLPSNNQIFAVSVIAYARKGDLDDRKIGLLVKPDGGTETEIQLNLTESFKYYQATFETMPGGGTWNQNNVESLQFGIRTR